MGYFYYSENLQLGHGLDIADLGTLSWCWYEILT